MEMTTWKAFAICLLPVVEKMILCSKLEDIEKNGFLFYFGGDRRVNGGTCDWK